MVNTHERFYDEGLIEPLVLTNATEYGTENSAGAGAGAGGTSRVRNSSNRNIARRRRTTNPTRNNHFPHHNDRSSINLNHNSTRSRDNVSTNSSNGNGPIRRHLTCHGCCCIQCVRTNEVAIMSECGKFDGIRNHGLLCLPLWPFKRVEKRLSLRVQQLDLVCETKTRDNVFVTLEIAILFKVEDPYKAHYKLTNPIAQIQSYVFDQVRSTIPSLDIDDLFIKSQDVSLDILRSIQFFMSASYGYDINNVLILNIYPSDVKVRTAMNEINSCKRMKEAMVYRGEAEKIDKIKNAEAESEAMYLRGIGVAKERQAIVEGIKNTMVGFDEHNDIKAANIPRKQVMDLLLVTQYYDTLLTLSENSDNDEGHMILEFDNLMNQNL